MRDLRNTGCVTGKVSSANVWRLTVYPGPSVCKGLTTARPLRRPSKGMAKTVPVLIGREHKGHDFTRLAAVLFQTLEQDLDRAFATLLENVLKFFVGHMGSEPQTGFSGHSSIHYMRTSEVAGSCLRRRDAESRVVYQSPQAPK